MYLFRYHAVPPVSAHKKLPCKANIINLIKHTLIVQNNWFMQTIQFSHLMSLHHFKNLLCYCAHVLLRLRLCSSVEAAVV